MSRLVWCCAAAVVYENVPKRVSEALRNDADNPPERDESLGVSAKSLYESLILFAGAKSVGSIASPGNRCDAKRRDEEEGKRPCAEMLRCDAMQRESCEQCTREWI